MSAWSAPLLPTGTVTFLFTDVEGSTRLWEAHPQAMRAVMARHDALLTRVFEQHDGVVVRPRGEGDSLFAVFIRATDAVAAALAGQQALTTDDWGDVGPLRVRMGLHTGEADLRDGDYYGSAVNRCARIRAAGHGGQVLLSQATALLVRGALPPDAGLRDLGRHRLKDLADPEHLFQLVHRDLAVDFPPPVTLDASAATQPATRAVLVGRSRELAALTAQLEAALAGRGSTALLAGEPGIGKSRLATELAALARQQGAQVLWGHCWEDAGAPAFWPWVQILRLVVRDHDPQLLRARLGSGAALIAQLVPEVRERLPDLPLLSTLAAPEQARFDLFDALATCLRRTAAVTPLVLLLDDLHWADAPSLLLLQFLAQQLRDAPLLLVGTYRDAAVDRRHPLARALAALTREPGTVRLELRGLAAPEVTQLVTQLAGLPLAAELVTAIEAGTDGNPFFITEVVRLLATEGPLEQAQALDPWRLPVPRSVQEVIAQRLERLSEDCTHVLALAAVIGQEFSLPLLAHVQEPNTDVLLPADRRARLLSVLEEATAAQLVVVVSAARQHYRFAHALIRAALYEELPPTRRAHLHQQVGAALESLWAAEPAAHLAELAHHFSQATPAGPSDKAIAYTQQAGEQALALLAFEEAVRYFELAVALLALEAPPDQAHQGTLLLELGEAQMRSGETLTARETFQQAAAVARKLGAPELLARAAVGFGGPVLLVLDPVDGQLIPLLEEALAALSAQDSPVRVRVLARLAGSLFRAAPSERGLALSAEAVAMARRLDEPATLAAALSARHLTLAGPHYLEERLAVADELIRLAEAVGDRELAVHGRAFRLADLVERGPEATIVLEHEAVAHLSEGLRQPFYRWAAIFHRAMRALWEGRFAEGEQLAQQAFAFGQQAQYPDAIPVFVGQLFVLRFEQGRLAELEPMLQGVAMAQALPTVAIDAVHAFLCSELGREPEARAAFARVARSGFTALPQDLLWLTVMSLLAQTCAYLGDGEHAEELYACLLPYASRNVVLASAVCLGPVARYLGLLTGTLHQWDAAVTHYDAAITLTQRLGARPWLAHTQADYAALLLARGVPTDHAQVGGLLAAAAATAQELGMPRLVTQVSSLQLQVQQAEHHAAAQAARSRVVLPGGLTAREVEVLRLLAGGQSNRDIAATLVLSVPTVERHLANIYGKLRVRGRAEAAAYAVRHQLVPTPEA